jgi:hypothetical protein
MSKKLLNESTIRRFMGLANLAPLSESFLDEKVNEEEEVTESEETVDEGGAAARVGNEGHDVGKGRMTADRIHEEDAVEEEVKAEGLVTIQEDELEDEEEEAAEMGGEVAMDAELDMGAEEPELDMGAEEGGMDLAAKAQSILADLADLLTQAGIETTVTSDEEEAADMGVDAEEDAMAVDAPMLPGEEEEELEEPLAEAGDLNGTKPNESNAVNALVAEITSKVINRLNK